MKVTEHLKNNPGKTLLSFEILPPLKGKSIESIYEVLDPLVEFKPAFKMFFGITSNANIKFCFHTFH